jgi:hypothetical protein
MVKRWVITFAVLGVSAAPIGQRTLQAQPVAAAPVAAVPAWIPPPAPAPPVTLWRFLGIPQGFQRIGDARLNRNGNFPGLERKPPLKPIAHPENLLSNNPAIKKAAEIKMQEDLAKQKIKAIKYLAKLGCDKCYGGVKEAMMAALDDCTEQVRYEAAKALGEAAVQHCDVCSRQCCCDEELTKKLAQIVYELDDKGCPIEPSERVREAAREALLVCCPNVGPPGYTPEVITPEVPPVIPEIPPERPPETPPPETPGELPPPPGRNGVAPLPNGLIPDATTPPIPNARPAPFPGATTGMFLRSRADRMAATSQVRRVVRPRAGAPQRPVVAQATRQQPASDPPPQPDARIVVSDEASTLSNADAGATVTVGDGESGQGASGGLRIRMLDRSASSEAPASMSSPSPDRLTSGSTVRIRDGGDDLQLASVTEAIVDHGGTAAPLVDGQAASSRRNTATVTDLPPVNASSKYLPASASRYANARRPATEMVTSVQSVKPQGTATKSTAAQGKGKVTDIDAKSGTVKLNFAADQAPATGTLVKAYHQFLLGEECVGALEVVSVRNGVVTARPVGNLSLSKLSLDDQVAYQGAGSNATGELMATGAATANGTVRR